MQNNKININYSAEDIQQYLKGNLTALQRNAIEKAALKDPFLAEAIEGYSNNLDKDWTATLSELKNTFKNKGIKNNKVIPILKNKFIWQKVAAAAIILIGSAVGLSYFILNKNNNNTIADKILPTQNNISKIVSDTAINKIEQNKEYKKITIPNGKNESSSSEGVKDITKKESDIVITKPNEPNNTPPISSVENKEIPKENNITSIDKSLSKDDEKLKVEIPTFGKNEGTAVARGIAKINNQQLKKGTSNKFDVQIVNTENIPLPFAKVNLKNDNDFSYTDVNGNLALTTNDSAINLEIKAVGYQSKIVSLQNNSQQNKIVLQEENIALNSKKAASGNLSKSKDQLIKINRKLILLKDINSNIEPLNGWENYNVYINNNVVLPNEIITKNMIGSEEVSVEINENGTVKSIKILKSGSKYFDEMVLKLLNEGPKWKTKNNKRATAKLTFQY